MLFVVLVLSCYFPGRSIIPVLALPVQILYVDSRIFRQHVIAIFMPRCTNIPVCIMERPMRCIHTRLVEVDVGMCYVELGNFEGLW